jgi:hypothetical protein
LLNKGRWSSDCQKAFNQAKTTLVTLDILFHYNPNFPISPAADASNYGIGAIISLITDGEERPNPEH